MSNESIVQEWNELYPPGTEVELTNDDGEVERTKTRSIAWLLGSGHPVVSVAGRTGGYLLERIKPYAKGIVEMKLKPDYKPVNSVKSDMLRRGDCPCGGKLNKRAECLECGSRFLIYPWAFLCYQQI